jgi:hypothetical protein
MAQINKPNLYFNTKIYTGNGSAGLSQTGVGFQPDWIWFKNRSQTASHNVMDAVRGSSKTLLTDSTTKEITDTDRLQSFDSDGFTVGANVHENGNGNAMVAWNWKANGTGSSNSDGTITSTASASTTAGFSIVRYTATGSNATVGHSLGAVPKMIIVKDTADNGGSNWAVYHASLGNTKRLGLNLNEGQSTDSAAWNNTTPTSSVFSIGTSSLVNNVGNATIAYCFAEKKGYSKFGIYTGNGNSNGAFIYLGFKPSFFMLKRTDANGDKWRMWDNKRSPFNLVDDSLAPNEASAEYDDSSVSLDFLSNGVKMRMSGGGAGNGSGESYIYMAFAEEPIVGTNNVAATAK